MTDDEIREAIEELKRQGEEARPFSAAHVAARKESYLEAVRMQQGKRKTITIAVSPQLFFEWEKIAYDCRFSSMSEMVRYAVRYWYESEVKKAAEKI